MSVEPQACKRTWVCDADLDVATHEARLGLGQCLTEPFWGRELNVSKSFRLAVHLVFHDSYRCDLAVAQEVLDVR